MLENSHKIRVSARAVIFDGDRILLNKFGNGEYYNFPGGVIEEHETAKMAVVREVREETGLEVATHELVFALEYEPHSGGFAHGDGHHISLFFRCELLSGNQLAAKPFVPDTSLSHPGLISQPVWFPIGMLMRINLLPHINENMQKYYESGSRRVFEPLYLLSIL